MRPIAPAARPRTGAGTSAHDGWARLAAAHAAAKVAASASATSATTSASRDGFGELTMPAGAPSAGRPPMTETMLLAMLTTPQ